MSDMNTYKPEPPLNRIIREGDTNEKCVCGSSLYKKHWWSRPRIMYGCINPSCGNYYSKPITSVDLLITIPEEDSK